MIYIPEWVAWSVAVIVWLTASARIFFAPSKSDFDFSNAFWGIGLLLAGGSFFIGALLF